MIQICNSGFLDLGLDFPGGSVPMLNSFSLFKYENREQRSLEGGKGGNFAPRQEFASPLIIDGTRRSLHHSPSRFTPLAWILR